MKAFVPAAVESRIRQKWKRRAKWKAYAIAVGVAAGAKYEARILTDGRRTAQDGSLSVATSANAGNLSEVVEAGALSTTEDP